MKYLSFNRNHSAVVITLMIVVFLGSLYFLIYVPQNEKRLQEQRFRTLQNIHNNIQDRISNSIGLMKNLLKDNTPAGYVNYLSEKSKSRFTLSTATNDSAVVAEIQQQGDTSFVVSVTNNGQQIVLQVLKKIQDKKVNGLAMKFTSKQFIETILPENVFDQYIVFTNGSIIYESFPSGISYTEDSLIQKKNGIASASVKSMTIGGNEYKCFLQPVNFSKTKWVIGGLLFNQRYQKEKNQLPSNIVLLLLTAVLIIIVAFPWIKLYQMGSKDRLTITDGIASIVVSMLLMSLLFFSFFKYNVFLRPSTSPDAKTILADKISNAFYSEIENAYKQLKAIDELVQRNPEAFKNLNNLDKLPKSDSGKTNFNGVVDSILQGIKVNQVFWLDNKGDEKVNWLAGEVNAPLGNYAHRAYYKSIVESNNYLSGSDTSKKYFIDQVISWATGKFTTVLSIPSGVQGQAVSAMSFDLKSIASPVLTTGFHFAIIEANGRVLYHSDSTRNLNENMIDEFSERDQLVSCLQSRSQEVFLTKYFSKTYNIRVSPLHNLPYFLIVFSDTSYKETRDLEIYSFSFSMMLLLFSLLVCQLFVVFIVSARQSFFKKQLFSTGWIGPKKSSHHQYNLAVLYNLLIIILLVIFLNRTTFLTYLFILLSSVTMLSIFLNTLFAIKYRDDEQHDNLKFKTNSLWSLGMFILVINIAAYKSLDKGNFWLSFFLFQIITIAAGVLLYFTGDSFIQQVRKGFLYLNRHHLARASEKWNYSRSFAVMALTRLVITSGIPILFFYISAYNFEQNINIRYRQLQFANALSAKYGNTSLASITANHPTTQGYFIDSAWINQVTTTSDHRVETYTEEEKITTRVLSMFRLFLTQHAVNEDKLYTSNSPDSSILFNPLLKQAIRKDSSTVTYKATAIPREYLLVGSTSLNYKMPSITGKFFWRGILFWTLLIMSLLAFYLMIFNVINKLFCLKLPNLLAWKNLDDKILSTPDLNNLVFVIGLPGSGKLARIKEKIRTGEINNGDKFYQLKTSGQTLSNVFVADLINIPDEGVDREKDEEWQSFSKKVFAEQNRLIIVNHFEYNIQDAITNRVKLNFLERLMLENKARIIILSTIHPVAFLDSIQEQSISTSKGSPGEDLERWHVLLGHYRILVFPLEEAAITAKSEFMAIEKEMRRTHFLNKMKDITIELAKQLPVKERQARMDELAFKLQVTSHYFYMYIWQSLTKEEKFLLYDLAEDNLVNSFDDYNLNLLLAKGIITRPDGTLTLFNRGFRNFILSAIGNSEAMKIKKHIRENGNWSRLKNPLIIIIIAILTFLLSSQEEAYSKLITYVAALAAGIPAILKIFSFFDVDNAKKTT
jgi:hypothetical protein